MNKVLYTYKKHDIFLRLSLHGSQYITAGYEYIVYIASSAAFGESSAIFAEVCIIINILDTAVVIHVPYNTSHHILNKYIIIYFTRQKTRQDNIGAKISKIRNKLHTKTSDQRAVVG